MSLEYKTLWFIRLNEKTINLVTHKEDKSQLLLVTVNVPESFGLICIIPERKTRKGRYRYNTYQDQYGPAVPFHS